MLLQKQFLQLLYLFLLKKPTDFYLVPLLNSGGLIFVGIWSLILIKRYFGVSFKIQPIGCVLFYLKDGWYIFISNISVSLYTVTTTVILGVFTNNTIVGYYSVADKLINALKGMISPISQTLFPYITRIALNSKQQALFILRSILLIFGGFMFLISTILFIFADIIIIKLFGTKATESIIILRILAIVPFFVTLDTIFGNLNMLVFKRNKIYSRIILNRRYY